MRLKALFFDTYLNKILYTHKAHVRLRHTTMHIFLLLFIFGHLFMILILYLYFGNPPQVYPINNNDQFQKKKQIKYMVNNYHIIIFVISNYYTWMFIL